MRLFWTTVPKPLEKAVAACRPHFLIAALFSALINILYLAPTIYMMQVYDRVVPTAGLLTLLWITVLVGIAIATLAALEACRANILMRASLRLNRLMAQPILDRLISRSKVKAGDPSTAQAMREFDGLRQAFGGPAASAMFDVPWTPLYFIVAFMIHPLLGGLLVVGGAILAALAFTNSRRTKARAIEANIAMARAYAAQEGAIDKAEIIRALGMQRGVVAGQIDERRIGLEATADVQFAGSYYSGTVKFFRMFMQSFALGTGAFLAVKGEISVGAIIAASVLLSRGLQPVEQLVGAWPGIVQARQAMLTLARLFESTEVAIRTRTALPLPLGRLELDRVVVRSPEGSAILLKNVTMRINPGEILGVIGPSGAGKTTLARVLAGAVSPDLGEVRLDDANVTDWDPETLAQHIGYLPQESSLLSGTISENISRFALARGVDRQVTDSAVVEAGRLAGIHELILHLPDGYDTRIGAGGHQLSAGQAQRVALARAMYGNPRILVLDEPNSALDAEGEEALARAVAAARLQGAAIMIIAHRASILRSADRLLVLDEGSVVQFGPRDEVMNELQKRAAQMNVVPIKDRAS